ncbi:MAG: hypothetical protein JWN13_4664 [Betaproteobacteria bacterium]|nr:hypothetical protein [Betaproteobacteria bacterium]
MSLDDWVLSLQHTLDRSVRRFRRGEAPAITQRRLLIVQIDGLSRAVLERGIDTRRMPFLKSILKHYGYMIEPMSVGLPTSTPAFQMAAMYGVRPDIPGFHYFNRERQSDIHFPRPGHAAWVEEKLASGRRGIVHGGSTYGCVFTGGADNNFFSFTSLTKPSGRGILSALSPFVVVAWVLVKNTALSVGELSRAVVRFIAHPRMMRRGWRWTTMKIGMSVWVRGFFTMAVSRDLYAGTPAIYVNYLNYDVAAHAFGPRSVQAMQALQDVDRALHQLWRVMRRVPEHRYDFYVLSDHGQAGCTPYRDVCKGQRLERWIFDQFLHPAGADEPEARARSGLAQGIQARRRGTTGLFQQFLNYIEEDFLRRGDPEAYERGGVRVISAGPNAFLYVLDQKTPLDIDALERRYPALPEKLSQSRGIGFVFARSPDGPVCFWRGERLQLHEMRPGPFAARPDAAIVVNSVADLMRMPSAGDLVIYGNDSTQGTVSYIPERGAHAGPSSEEMNTFVVRPGHVNLPLPLIHPIQLYPHFIQYQQASQ